METASFIDGLGRRFARVSPSGERLEVLHLCAEVPASPATEAALVERVASLARFDHGAYTRVRRVERLGSSPRAQLAVVSEAALGVRLSDLLRESERRLADRDVDGAVHLLRQAVSGVAALHRHAPEIAHGAIGPERLVLRPDGTLVIVEAVLGAAIEALQYSRLQLWTLFRVAAPSSAGTARLDHQADVLQLGVLALALLLGRVLRREEFPHGLPAVLEEAASPDAARNYPGCSRALRAWIGRALQFEMRTAFRTAVEAERGLTRALEEDARCRPSAAAVQRFLASCSFESLCAAVPPPSPRTTTPGAVVSVGGADRGSGAHRVCRQAMPGADQQANVLAELPPAPVHAPSPPPARRRSPLSVFRFPLTRSR